MGCTSSREAAADVSFDSDLNYDSSGQPLPRASTSRDGSGGVGGVSGRLGRSVRGLEGPARARELRVASRSGADPRRELGGGGSRSSPAAPVAKPGDEERVSAKTLERMRSTFLSTASYGSVYDNYTLSTTLGTGGYAVVKLGEHKETGRQVAVKIVKLPAHARLHSGHAMHQQRAPGASSAAMGSKSLVGAAEMEEEDVFKEIEILKSLNHPAILKLHEYFIAGARDKVYLVTELLRGGELLEALLERGSYSERDARAIFEPILQGVAYLHTMRVTHRDLKLENLLLANRADLSSVRIADFGLAKAVFETADDPRAMRLVCGTPAYVAPEIITRRVYTPAVDLWSCGVILYILLSGVVPFEDPDEARLFALISRAAYSLQGPEFEAVSPDAKRLIAALLCLDPNWRLTAVQALGHPWFSRGSRRHLTVGSPQELAAAAAALAAEEAAETAALQPLPSAAGKLAVYAARIKMPIRIFAPGEYLIRRGERATEMYLLRAGTCALVLEEGADAAPAERTVDSRGPGDFVGEVGVVMTADGKVLSHLLPPSAAPAGVILEEEPPSPTSPSDAPRTAAGDKWAAALLARKAAKKWVGSRRTTSVRAVSEVTAVVLRRREMAWALENDESLSREVRHAVERAQKEAGGAL